MAHDNPYQPPQSPVLDFLPPPAPDTFLPRARVVAGARGTAWYGDAWRLLMAHAGLWLVILVIIAVLALSASLPPWLSVPLQYLLFPFALATLAAACDAVRRESSIRADEIFAALSARSGQLLLVGLIYLLGIAVASIIAIVPLLGWDGLGVLYGALKPEDIQQSLMPLMLAMLILIAVSLPLFMSIWFAPTLVLLHGVNAPNAMLASLSACARNLWPFFLYSIAGLVLAIAATLPLLLGWLVLVPVMMVTGYSAYRDLFFDHPRNLSWTG